MVEIAPYAQTAKNQISFRAITVSIILTPVAAETEGAVAPLDLLINNVFFLISNCFLSLSPRFLPFPSVSPKTRKKLIVFE